MVPDQHLMVFQEFLKPMAPVANRSVRSVLNVRLREKQIPKCNKSSRIPSSLYHNFHGAMEFKRLLTAKLIPLTTLSKLNYLELGMNAAGNCV